MIRNRESLATTDAEELALECVEAGIDAATPRRVVDAAVESSGEWLRIADDEYDLSRYERVLVVGGGNAAGHAAAAIEDVLGDRIDEYAVGLELRHMVSNLLHHRITFDLTGFKDVVPLVVCKEVRFGTQIQEVNARKVKAELSSVLFNIFNFLFEVDEQRRLAVRSTRSEVVQPKNGFPRSWPPANQVTPLWNKPATEYFIKSGDSSGNTTDCSLLLRGCISSVVHSLSESSCLGEITISPSA